MGDGGPARRWGSPLVEVERAVQERAKALALDMARPDGRAVLGSAAALGVVGPYELADPAGVAERAWRNLAGYGPLERS